MDSRQQFEEWMVETADRFHPDFTRRGIEGEYQNVGTEHDWCVWQASRAESEDMKSARRDLDKAIHALTDSLDYEWTGDFRPEIEKLNGAHMR